MAVCDTVENCSVMNLFFHSHVKMRFMNKKVRLYMFILQYEENDHYLAGSDDCCGFEFLNACFAFDTLTVATP